MPTSTDFWVGDRFVRPSLGDIQLGPERVHLEPRSMEVLLALARTPSEVVPKKELIEAVWGDAFVSDEVLTHAIWDLRRALGDSASDPEFIQTIPKIGYRLIAPVKPIEAELRRATDRDPAAVRRDEPRQRRSGRLLAWGLALLVVMALAGTWWSRRAQVGQGSEAPSYDALLTLVATQPPAGKGHWAAKLDDRLVNQLSGLDRIRVRRAAACEAGGAAGPVYCLQPRLLPIDGGTELGASLSDPRSARELYAPPLVIISAAEELEAGAEELSGLIGAYFEVVRDPYSRDPDIVPWINVRRHDPRAIRDFLLGVRYVYRHDVGGRDAMALAMKTDPGFIAPRVWRTPAIADEGDAQTRTAHRQELERLYAGSGSGFEKSMIKWAQAVLDGDIAEQLLQLDVALELEPGNRPAIIARGVAHMELAEYNQAWVAFDQLLKARWNFPGLYPLAAYCAVSRDQIGDLRRALEPALGFETVDPHSLALSRQLAIFDELGDREAELGDRLETRRKEQPEGLDPEFVRAVAGYLAAKAEAQGREPIAKRLRESAN